MVYMYIPKDIKNIIKSYLAKCSVCDKLTDARNIFFCKTCYNMHNYKDLYCTKCVSFEVIHTTDKAEEGKILGKDYTHLLEITASFNVETDLSTA